jgi:hypothetical protein
LTGANLLNDLVSEGPGIVFSAIQQSGICSAKKRRGRAGGVDLIPSGEVVLFSLFASAFCPNGWTRIDKIFEWAIGADDRADIASLHHKWGREAKLALKIHEVLAKFGKSGDDGDSGVDLRKTGVRTQITVGFTQSDFPVLDLRMEIDLLEKLFHSGAGGGVVARFEG